MSDETKCPKCGSDYMFTSEHGSQVWRCTSMQKQDGKFEQSDRCRITQLEQQLAVAVAARTHVVEALKRQHLQYASLMEGAGGDEFHFYEGQAVAWLNASIIAAEALKQIGATP